MFRWFFAALMLIGAVSLRAEPLPVSPTGVIGDRFPQPVVRIGDVQVLADVTYVQPVGFRPLRLDLYSQPVTGRRPLVVFVHGGGWTTGHKRATAYYADFPGLLASLARKGFVVASAEYRLSGEKAFPGAADDVKIAVNFLRANAVRYGIDPGRIVLWGGSAGAHIAAMAAFTDAHVQGFIGWYGPYDVDALLARQLAAVKAGVPMDAQAKSELTGGLSFFGCTLDGCPPGVARAASPIAQVDAADPPTLLVHGIADTLVPPAQSEAFEAVLRKAGVPVEMVMVPGANHGWASKTPAETTAASQRAVAVTFDWLQKHFPQ
jgi:acetyl esterase/lipase